MTFDTYEVGKITLDEYLERLLFYEKRYFTPVDFIEFMMSKSESFPAMIQLIKDLKKSIN